MKATYTEAMFTRDVLSLAAKLGWVTAHFRPAMTSKGWRTAVQGHGKGFPDLVLLKGKRQLVVELKVGRNKPTPEQVLWLGAFRDAGVDARLWWPKDWPEIEATLKGEAP